MEATLDLLSIDALHDTITSLPTSITVRANSFASLHAVSARATLVVERTPIARILDASVVLSVLGKFPL